MISIIIPTFNEEKLLPVLLGSIKIQSIKDIEIIVSDNNSTDSTRLLAKKEGAKIVNGGMPAKGRNEGAKVAQGDWFLFLDADVILPPNFLKEALSEIKKRKLMMASCLIKPLSDKKIDLFLHGIFNNYMKLTMKIFTHAPGCCIFVKSEIHRKLGGFNEKVKIAEDHDYANRARKMVNFGILEKVKIPVSVRRLDRDGRLNIALKYLVCEIHLVLFGPIYSNIFNYKFGYSNKK